jgi:DNA ligase-1
MRFTRIAQTWAAVGATRSRLRKVTLLADTLAELAAHAPEVLAAGTAMLTGSPRQGRLGVGWATLREVTVDPVPDDEASLGVADVDAAFAEIATTQGPGSVATRHDLLTSLWSRATAAEQALLRGLVLQELRQGALEGVVTAAVARAAGLDEALVRRAAMLTGDLTAAAVLAMEDEAAVRAVALEVGRGVQPMLASSAPDVATALATTGPARVDTKLDGMRIQVHRRGDDVRVFSRSLRDVTSSVPEVVGAVAAMDVDTVVLDGEALARRDDGTPLPFQDSMAESGVLHPHFFDILHLDGRDLLDDPLSRRLEVLGGVVGGHGVTGVVTDDPEVATDHLRDALAAGNEGIVVKALDSTWQAGRRGSDWVKVKVAHTLDLVVLAAEWGSGRRTGWLSNLHLGAVEADTGEPVMLGKTFKGLTDDLLAWQTDALLALEVERRDHVVHVRPELVVEVAFDGVQASQRYPGGVTLRFARVKRYRPDKTPDEADTIQAVRAIHRGERAPRL